MHHVTEQQRIEAYENGKRASRAGKLIEWCPYYSGPEREAWKNGWRDSQRDAKASDGDDYADRAEWKARR